MQTLFLGKEQISAYVADLQHRLVALGNEKPTVWVPIGFSGGVILESIFRTAKELNKSHPIVLDANCRRDPKTKALDITWGKAYAARPPRAKLAGKRVMVIDSAVHSGSTMAAVTKAVMGAGAAGVCTYSLVLKESSAFIPNYWAVSIGDEDRAYFLLNAIPNNRFVRPIGSADDDGDQDGLTNALPESLKVKLPYFSLRKLSHRDVTLPKFKVATESLNRSTWADLYYQMSNSPTSITYVLDIKGEPAAYITLDMPTDDEMSIEQVATAKQHAGNGYAGALLRWAETLGRLRNCMHIRLCAIDHLVHWYGKRGFEILPDAPLDLGDEKYIRMRKCLLPHTGCCSHLRKTKPGEPAPAPEKP